MMVREEGDKLHLLSVVSPEWMGKGKSITVSQVPTNFGTVGFKLEQTGDDDAVLHVDASFTHAPRAIVLHQPWFVEGETATVDGVSHQVLNGEVELPAGTREIHLHWTPKADAPQMSYARTVEEYKAEYARRYQLLMHGAPGANK
jgi:hypothetical protein